jgi:2-keto-4-pentenoate hydratase/2-oxohepta-3-ene-1,7-dioic acid hydratase in catechol pathway
MRLVTYQRNGHARSGVVVGDAVFDTGFATTRAALEAATIEPRERAGTLDELVLGPPITDPDKIICLGLNYRDHAAESGLALPKAPMLFAKFRNSLAGPTAPIVLPARGELFDYEAELAVVIGRRGKDIAADEALEYVAGAMVLNDVTARDVQHATSQWTAGKAIDTFAPCGPALVLMDEIEDLQNLSVKARVNGVTVQDGHTSQMIFGVAETIAFVSSLMTLEVGDIIATGTPAGVGVSRDPQVLLRDGDVVEIEIEGLGVLSNPVAALVAAGR